MGLRAKENLVFISSGTFASWVTRDVLLHFSGASVSFLLFKGDSITSFSPELQ